MSLQRRDVMFALNFGSFPKHINCPLFCQQIHEDFPMHLPRFFACCVPVFFSGISLSVFDPRTAFATQFSVQRPPCFRVECGCSGQCPAVFAQSEVVYPISVLRNFLRISDKALQFSCRVKFNARSHLSLDGIPRLRNLSTANEFSR